jgi:hypothetical protein
MAWVIASSFRLLGIANNASRRKSSTRLHTQSASQNLGVILISQLALYFAVMPLIRLLVVRLA